MQSILTKGVPANNVLTDEYKNNKISFPDYAWSF